MIIILVVSWDMKLILSPPWTLHEFEGNTINWSNWFKMYFVIPWPLIQTREITGEICFHVNFGAMRTSVISVTSSTETNHLMLSRVFCLLQIIRFVLISLVCTSRNTPDNKINKYKFLFHMSESHCFIWKWNW